MSHREIQAGSMLWATLLTKLWVLIANSFKIALIGQSI